MGRARPAKHWRRLGMVAATALMASACDHGTKAWATRNLADGDALTLWDPWLQLQLAYNRGTAFSLIRDVGDGRFVLGAVALLVVAALGWIAWRSDADARGRAVALGLLMGGALGNLVDRLAASGGGVVDFVRINLPGGYTWPTFNVADVVIVLGVALLFLTGRRAREPQPA